MACGNVNQLILVITVSDDMITWAVWYGSNFNPPRIPTTPDNEEVFRATPVVAAPIAEGQGLLVHECHTEATPV